MSKVTLIINDETEYVTQHPVITFGRTADNNVALDDTNVSRYHARIEQREDGYWLIDQDSSNGSSVNGNQVDGEMLLENNDVILFGGSSRIRFTLPDEAKEEDSIGESVDFASSETQTEEEKKKNSSLMYVAGGVVGLAVISVAVAGFVIFGGPSCEAKVSISGAESGEVLKQSTEIVAEVEQSTPCVGKAVFFLDGREIGSTKASPYTITLDSEDFYNWNDGVPRRLKVVLADKEGQPIVPAGSQNMSEVSLVFETPIIAEEKPKEDVKPKTEDDNPVQQPTEIKKFSEIETQQMILTFLKNNFPNAPGYKLNQQFLIDVNKKLPEYISEGYFAKAQQYRDVINVVYVQENDVNIALGYILAMSRSKFNAGKQDGGDGLWRISNDLINASGFNLNELCGNENLSNPSQNCSAKISALYLKPIIKDYFENDIIYTVASFGKTAQEVDTWRLNLTADRKDFWNRLNPKQKEEVARFFAAGIVAENPQKFGLKKDQPISNLYKNLIGN